MQQTNSKKNCLKNPRICSFINVEKADIIHTN